MSIRERSGLIPWVVAMCLIVSPYWIQSVGAQCNLLETRQLLPPDVRADDQFGSSVAIGGRIAVVGAAHDISERYTSGTAYLFDAGTGQQIAKFYRENAQAYDQFGCAVAIDGSTVVVGAKTCEGQGLRYGAAFVFDISDSENPVETHRLEALDPHVTDDLGKSVAVSGRLALVGAPDKDGGLGAAYLFDVTTGEQLAKLEANDGERGDLFGFAVAIESNVALISAVRDLQSGVQSGSVYVFDVSDPRNPMETDKWSISNNAPDAQFGRSVALDGSLALIGAFQDLGNGQGSGAAYLFDIPSGTQVARLVPEFATGLALYGCSVGMSGNRIVIGAYKDDDYGRDSGSAYVYDISQPAQPVLIGKCLANFGNSMDYFGSRVDISESTVVVGSEFVDQRGGDSGSAYLFDTDRCRLELGAEGVCPGRLVLTVESATPGAQVVLLGALGTSVVRLPSGGPCPGISVNLDRSVVQVRSTTADGDGAAVFYGRVSQQYCGRAFVQGLDLSDCRTSNVERVQ